MAGEWTEERLQALIRDQIEESSSLEYKGADKLGTLSDGRKREVTRDVSAIANAAGGTLIYGMGLLRIDGEGSGRI